ncbi:ATP-grasp fold amidoligase family protein [Acerihabitans sp. TG2]|uniref:ATP-grasp fold amidoligase family protein n=1 Tax=Acerihabitans sp. TG2 TaxID=3096008 RepID=UPI002B23A2AC|nr:ATP-grasp fold amidoligase family protein [Acerihabitans sp. TG2]MEA9392570.1 ATP-grasp fold amidoligase family protein [Acerihabitans sp. TG2]
MLNLIARQAAKLLPDMLFHQLQYTVVFKKLRYNPILHILTRQAYKFLPDMLYHQLRYARIFKHWPNFSKPTTFSEKIVIRNFRPKPIYTNLADKFKVRNYIAGAIGEKYLIKLHACCSELTPAIYESLPDAFVIKANHGSGFNLVVPDKSQTTFSQLSTLTRYWTEKNFYKINRERHYKAITPCIMVEELLQQDGHVPNDIKFHCFNQQGEMNIFIQVDYDRFGVHRRDVFDTQWNKTDIRMGLPNSTTPMDKPKNLTEMVALATRLASDFNYVRVDFYEADGSVYFGELTFTPGAGLCRMYPEGTQHQWGSLFAE